MHIIKTMADVRRLKLAGSISPELAAHFDRKIRKTKENLAPELDLEDFNMEMHGVFGVLEASDRDLTALGLPESLALVMPEWVSCLKLKKSTYYVAYFVFDNDGIDQLYVPEEGVAEKIRLWLSEQPAEEESEEDDASKIDHPF